MIESNHPNLSEDSTTSSPSNEEEEVADPAAQEERPADPSQQPTEEEIQSVSPIGGLFPKWDRHHQSTGKILLYCLLFVVVLILIGYFGNR